MGNCIIVTKYKKISLHRIFHILPSAMSSRESLIVIQGIPVYHAVTFSPTSVAGILIRNWLRANLLASQKSYATCDPSYAHARSVYQFCGQIGFILRERADFSIRGMFRFYGDAFDRIERDLISDGDAMDGCYRARTCLHQLIDCCVSKNRGGETNIREIHCKANFAIASPKDVIKNSFTDR